MKRQQEGAKYAIVYFETHEDALSAFRKKLRLGGRNLSISSVPVKVSTMIETILILYLIVSLFLLGGSW
jgi:ribosomal protein S6